MSNIIRNFRNGGGEFPTDMVCSFCGKASEVYKYLGSSGRICKSCLTEFIKEIDDAYVQEMAISTVGYVRDKCYDEYDGYLRGE